jgi:hypothetical protein
MRAGFKIHKFNEKAFSTFQISDKEKEKSNKMLETKNVVREKCESIAYGIDWSFDSQMNSKHKLAVGSFYDNRCDLWTAQTKI